MTDVRLCYVEDDPDVALTVKRILERHEGWRVTTAATKAEATPLLRGDRFDVVILDLQLPDGSGMDLIPVLRESAPETPVMVLTGSGDEGLALRSYELGALDYEVKGPQIARDLVGRIEEILSRSDDTTRAARVTTGKRSDRPGRASSPTHGPGHIALGGVVHGNVTGAALFDAAAMPTALDLPESMDPRVFKILCAQAVATAGSFSLATHELSRSLMVASATESGTIVMGTYPGGFAAMCYAPEVTLREAVDKTCEWIERL